MNYTAAQIKQLRDQTGARVLDCKKALEASHGEMDKAKVWVMAKGLARADQKSDRATKVGYVASYVHANNQTAALVEIRCETDFVARNEDFQTMAKDIAMQIVAMKPQDVTELLAQEYIKNPSQSVENYLKSVSGKVGEKFVINRFVRYQVGETK